MILYNATIVLPDRTITQAALEIEDKKIKHIYENYTNHSLPAGIDLQGKKITPGFIDMHNHGGYLYAFEQATDQAFSGLAHKLPQEGVTKYCQASVTSSVSNLVSNFKKYHAWISKHNKGPQARQIGIHMEGPFIAPEQKGAHELSLLVKPAPALLTELFEASGGFLKVVTFAPELASEAFFKQIQKLQLLPSAGHSNITMKAFLELAQRYQLNHITHLFNGMSKMDNHRPGLAAAGLYDDACFVEIISDGIHIKPNLIKLIYKIKQAEKIILITDATMVKGAPPGVYQLGNLPVINKKDHVVLANNPKMLAGSALAFDHGYRLFKKYTQASDQAMALCSAGNAAKQLKIEDQTGSIVVGKLADLVVLDQSDHVFMTICEGEIAYKRL